MARWRELQLRYHNSGAYLDESPRPKMEPRLAGAVSARGFTQTLTGGDDFAISPRRSTSGLSQRKLYYPLHNCRGSVSALKTRPSRDIFSYRTPTVMEGIC